MRVIVTRINFRVVGSVGATALDVLIGVAQIPDAEENAEASAEIVFALEVDVEGLPDPVEGARLDAARFFRFSSGKGVEAKWVEDRVYRKRRGCECGNWRSCGSRERRLLRLGYAS